MPPHCPIRLAPIRPTATPPIAAKPIVPMGTTHPGRATPTHRIAREPMATKRPLNARNLEPLGAERLADLLIQVSQGRPVARRLLRLELAGRERPAELAREVRQRLATIGRSRAAFDAQKRRDLLDEL